VSDESRRAAPPQAEARRRITQVNGEAVKTPNELKAALGAATDRPALLLVVRDNADLFLALSRPRS
jgi:hypothetical protein